MPKLADGTVYPNYMRPQPIQAVDPVEQRLYYDNALHVGNVIEAYAPSNKKNRNGKKWEYDVICLDFINRRLTQVTYRNCVVASSFGGSSDTASYTLRKGTKENPNSGSRVLVLCIAGMPVSPVIISTLNFNPEDEEDHLSLKFRDGEMKVNQKGSIFTRVKKDTDNV